MIIALAALVIGALIGALTAKRRKGSIYDIIQYAAGYGIAFGLLGMIASVVLVYIG